MASEGENRCSALKSLGSFNLSTLDTGAGLAFQGPYRNDVKPSAKIPKNKKIDFEVKLLMVIGDKLHEVNQLGRIWSIFLKKIKKL